MAATFTEQPASAGQQPSERPADTRLHHLDGLRALAAIWVVCNHVWLTIYPRVGAPGTPHGFLGYLTLWMAFGHFAVVAFIVLSGYSLSISTTRHGNRLTGGLGLFLRRRFTRIVLPYWGALLISFVLATTIIRSPTGTHWDTALPVTIRGVLLHLFLLQDLGDSGQINHALWSIAVEWHIYFLFSVILALRRRIGLVAATLVVVLLAAVVSHHFQNGVLATREAGLAGCFALGVAAQEIVSRGGSVPVGRQGGVRLPWGGVLLGFGVLVVGYFHHLGLVVSTSGDRDRTEPLVGAATAALLIFLGVSRHRALSAALSWRPLVYVGTFSYSLYLLHAPVVQVMWQYVMRPLGLPLHDGTALALLLPLALIASLAVGQVFFLLVERRCLPVTMRRSVDAELIGLASPSPHRAGRVGHVAVAPVPRRPTDGLNGRGR